MWSGLLGTGLVTRLWMATSPGLVWVCPSAFPKEHRLRKGFQTGLHQGDPLLTYPLVILLSTSWVGGLLLMGYLYYKAVLFDRHKMTASV